MRARNPNAVNGDPYGGSAELDQSLLWRPLASSGRHATPIDRLWHIGASTHPGPGLGGGSGHLVGTALNRRRFREVSSEQPDSIPALGLNLAGGQQSHSILPKYYDRMMSEISCGYPTDKSYA